MKINISGNLMKYVWDFIVFSALQKLHSNVNSEFLKEYIIVILSMTIWKDVFKVMNVLNTKNLSNKIIYIKNQRFNLFFLVSLNLIPQANAKDGLTILKLFLLIFLLILIYI